MDGNCPDEKECADFQERRETIFEEGDIVKGIYFILHGKVKIFMSWGSQKVNIVRLAGDGQILGHRGYGLDSIYPVSAVALEDTEVCFIDNQLFWTLVKTNPDLHLELTTFYADELKRTEQHLKHMACSPVKCRVAEALIIIKEAYGISDDGKLNYPLMRKDMAALAGTTYETVVRMLTELKEDKMIDLNGKNIQIKDQEALIKFCQLEGKSS